MRSTTTVHWNCDSIAREHNQRDEELCKNEPHIDLKNEHGSSYHEVLFRSDLEHAYTCLFQGVIDEYNQKQKRKDRQLTVKDYMAQIEADTRGRKQTKKVNGKRVAKETSRRGKQLSYEITVKVGNTERATDEATGKTLYDSQGHHIRPEWIDRAIQQEALKRYFSTFQKRNPNLVICNADLHCDEGFTNKQGVWEYAVDGLHLEIIPLADGFKQGLRIQNSMNKALEKLGYKGVDAYNKWAMVEQDYLADLVNEICKERGLEEIDFYHPVKDRSKQGGLSKEDYIKSQEIKEAEADLNASVIAFEASKEAYEAKVQEDARRAARDELQEEYQKVFKERVKVEQQKKELQEKLQRAEELINDLNFPVESKKDEYLKKLKIKRNGQIISAYNDFYNTHITPRVSDAWDKLFEIKDSSKDKDMEL